MKRTVLKRKTPIRRTSFRHLDAPPEHRASELMRKAGQLRAWNARDGLPMSYAERDRAITHVKLDDTEAPGVPVRHLAVAAPVDGHVPRKRITNARRNRYRDRPRFFDYMGWVKAQPCLMASYGSCHGVVEADHAGFDRGVGMKAHDNTCIPLCSAHHMQRHNFNGVFKGWTKEQMRAWRELAIQLTQETARRCGIEVPT
jgi:hypothetical protein